MLGANEKYPWNTDRIEEELGHLVRAIASSHGTYDEWYRILERTPIHLDMRAATVEQWERFNRYCALAESRLGELRHESRS